VLRELRGHTALTELSATHLTDVGVLELHDLTALTRLCLVDTSTTPWLGRTHSRLPSQPSPFPGDQ
jgi:hypothetical protein